MAHRSRAARAAAGRGPTAGAAGGYRRGAPGERGPSRGLGPPAGGRGRRPRPGAWPPGPGGGHLAPHPHHRRRRSAAPRPGLGGHPPGGGTAGARDCSIAAGASLGARCWCAPAGGTAPRTATPSTSTSCAFAAASNLWEWRCAPCVPVATCWRWTAAGAVRLASATRAERVTRRTPSRKAAFLGSPTTPNVTHPSSVRPGVMATTGGDPITGGACSCFAKP